MIEMEKWVDLQMNGSDTYHHDPMSLFFILHASYSVSADNCSMAQAREGRKVDKWSNMGATLDFGGVARDVASMQVRLMRLHSVLRRNSLVYLTSHPPHLQQSLYTSLTLTIPPNYSESASLHVRLHCLPLYFLSSWFKLPLNDECVG